MSYELGRALLASEVVSTSALSAALFAAVTHDVHLVRALLSTGALEPAALDRFLGRTDAAVAKSVSPMPELVRRLPARLCARLLLVPVRLDPVTGTVDVAMADVRDRHAQEEVRFHLAAPVRPLRAPLAAMQDALDRLAEEARAARNSYEHELVMRASVAARPGSSRPPGDTPPWGTPAVRVARASEPAHGLGSEIPIPLTRRTYAPAPGGTQRPPAFDLPDADDASTHGDRITRAYMLAAAPVAVEAPAPAARATDEVAEAVTTKIDPLTSLIPGPPPVASFRSPSGTPQFVPDTSAVVAAMKAAFDRDQVLELLLTGARAVAGRVAIFVVKRGGFVGWSCTPDFGERAQLQSLLVPLALPSVLSIAANEGLYLGALRHDEAHAPILRVMRTASRDVAACAVRVAGKPTLVILADELGDTMIATRRLEELARGAGEALGRILRARR